MDRASEKGKARDDAALKRRKSVDQEDDEDEVGAMTESFYSDISAAAGNGRHVSWSRATTGHPPIRASSFHQSPIEEGEQTPTLGGEIVGGEDDELRRRSRSRGRPSTRSRLQPLLVYNPASPVDDEGGEGTSAAHGAENRGLEVESERERASKSGSRRRSASIVFLSVGLGAFFVMNKGPSPASVHSPMGVARAGYPRGQVLDWQSVVEDAPRIPEPLVEETVVHFPPPDNSYADAKEEPTWTLDRSHKDRSRHDPPPLTPEQKRRLVGRISAWACTTLYLTSRLPQIWKNYTRGSVQGLSLALFVFAFLGNTFYVASILSSPIIWEYPSGGQPIDAMMYPDLNTVSTTAATTYSTSSPPAVSVPDPTSVYKHQYRHGGHLDSPGGDPIPPYRTPRARAFLRESMPYLLGSGGTLCFDVIIVTQGIIYGRREKMIEEEEDEEYEDEDGEHDDENEEGEREVEEGGNERREELDDREDTRLLKQAEEPGNVNDPGHAEERSRKVGDLLAPGDDRHG
ncbi:hypothetical protein FRC20_005804 [Serendipita sp. 405]|nr:hypothetical protein FRC20_005804 [Serendipita sp. 405]